jgi:hypothetical protein
MVSYYLLITFRLQFMKQIGHLQHLLLIAGLILGLNLEHAAAQQKYLYVADSGANKIFRVAVDGSGASVFLDNTFQSPEGVTLVENKNRIYWSNPSSSIIGIGNLQGSILASYTVSSGTGTPTDINADVFREKLYWSESSNSASIQRYDLSTSTEDTFYTLPNSTGVQGLAVDEESGDIYFADGYNLAIKKKSATGALTTIFSGIQAGPFYDVAISLVLGKVYWIESGLTRIQSANLDGSSTSATTVESNVNARGLALDESTTPLVLYFSVDNGIVFRKQLNGISGTPVVLANSTSGLINPRHLVLGKAPPLTGDTVITQPPAVSVDNNTNEVTFTFEEFSSPILNSALAASIPGKSAITTTSIRYIASVTNKSNNLIRKIVSKNTTATAKFAPGTYTVKYKALIVSPVSAVKKAAKQKAINADIAALQKQPATIANGNKIRAKKALLKIAGVRVRESTNISPESEEFTVE